MEVININVKNNKLKINNITNPCLILSNDIDSFAEQRSKQDKTGNGIIYDADNITITVKTWGELIQECKHRL